MPRCPRCDHEQSTPWESCPVCDAPFEDTGELDATLDSGTAAATEPAGDATEPAGTATAPAGTETAPADTTPVDDGATVVSNAQTPVPPPPTAPRPTRSSSSLLRSGLSSSSARADERFAPGTLLLDRYRILGKIGAGAMGEVYRADDLTLDQEVALKFLPEDFSADQSKRQRFLQEVRLARQVSHPNVCRVYDVGEVDGLLFLSMEYVAGRDLSSVLRSIGRFPEEKALDIARQLCAGVASLHDRGVLHRDLKPANVMLDDDGRLRITDFGLAGVAEQIAAHDVRSGTPLYMAPEQLEGREVTERSDIYALGLVLYEIFTGKKAYDAETLDQLKDLRQSSAAPTISSHVSEVDPAVERVVSRCLEVEPERRPPSAMVVATALPGGDPLAAALAMGETPSADLVAAAGGKGGIHPVLGLAFFLIALAGVLLVAGLGPRRDVAHFSDLDRSADALQERARQLVVDLGYDDKPVDRYHAFARSGAMLGWYAEQDSSQNRWDRVGEMRPTPLIYWYRQSPRYLLPANSRANVTTNDPAPLISDMVQVVLDSEGRLLYFEAMPPERPAPADSTSEAMWDRLFEAAALDRAAFAEQDAEWVPDVFADERRAWASTLEVAGHTIDYTVDAGSVAGRPVYFRLHGPWSDNHRTVTARPSARGADVFILLLVFAIISTGVTLAVRHHRRGRTDMRGAGRIAVVLMIMPIVGWLFGRHHAPLPDALLDRFFVSVSQGALYAVLCLLLYLALEPYVRRIWPEVMIGWTRLLSGGWRDPMVGRSVLIGGAMCGMSAILGVVQLQLFRAFDYPPPMLQGLDYYALATPRVMIGTMANQIPNALFNILFFLMMLVVLRLLTRRPWLTYLTFFLVTATVIMVQAGDLVIGAIAGSLLAALWLVTLVRGGMLAFAVGFFLWQVVQTAPLTLDFSQMHAAPSLMLLAAVFGLLGVAFSVALGGRSLLQDMPGK